MSDSEEEDFFGGRIDVVEAPAVVDVAAANEHASSEEDFLDAPNVDVEAPEVQLPRACRGHRARGRGRGRPRKDMYGADRARMAVFGETAGNAAADECMPPRHGKDVHGSKHRRALSEMLFAAPDAVASLFHVSTNANYAEQSGMGASHISENINALAFSAFVNIRKKINGFL